MLNSKLGNIKNIKLSAFAILTTICIFACSGTTTSNGGNESASNGSSAASSDVIGDMYFEYKTNTNSNLKASEKMNIQIDTKMYISAKGDTRMEMSTETSYNGKNASIPLVVIGHSDKPTESIYIDDSAKTFTVNHFADSNLVTGMSRQTISVTKVGEEKILGFKSVHARIVTKSSFGGSFSLVDTMDIWRSNDVPVVASVKNMLDHFETKSGSGLFSPDVVSQLKQMGCEGFMTKMEIHSEKSTVVEELVKVEHRSFPASMFEIPAGYKEDKSGM